MTGASPVCSSDCSPRTSRDHFPPEPANKPGSARLHRCQPRPWHAVATCEQGLQAAGFARLDETERWTLRAGDKRFTSCAVAPPSSPSSSAAPHLAETGLHHRRPYRFAGAAHQTQTGRAGGMVRLGVGCMAAHLATFADRDLSLAGRVNVRTRRLHDAAGALCRPAAPPAPTWPST